MKRGAGNPILAGTIAMLRSSLANDGIRRLQAGWTIGTAADAGLLVTMLIAVYAQDGAVGAGLLGAVRMVPAVISGMLSGALLARMRGDRILLGSALIRAACAAAAGIVILVHGPSAALMLLAALAAAAGAPVRVTQATLMPAIARSPAELVAGNMATTAGEGIGAFVGPFISGVVAAAGMVAGGAFASMALALIIAIFVGGLRLEQDADASGGMERAGGLQLIDGLRSLRQRPVAAWSIVGAYGQVLTRGLLNSLLVVAAVEVLAMGAGGVGLLTAALGLGGLFGAIFIQAMTRTDSLVRTLCAALAYWGAPLALIAIWPEPIVALLAMAIIGLANATFDGALFTLIQRSCANHERGAAFSLLEGVIGLGAVSGSLLGPILLIAFGNRGALAVGGAILPILALVIYARIGRADRVSVVDEALLQVVRAVPAFTELPLTAIERLVAGATPVSWPQGAVIMRQGDPGDVFVIVEHGEVDVLVNGQFMHRLGPGAGIGDIALLRRTPRTATVTAASDVRGHTVDAVTFLAAVSGPAAAAVTERIASAHLARAAAEA